MKIVTICLPPDFEHPNKAIHSLLERQAARDLIPGPASLDSLMTALEALGWRPFLGSPELLIELWKTRANHKLKLWGYIQNASGFINTMKAQVMDRAQWN